MAVLFAVLLCVASCGNKEKEPGTGSAADTTQTAPAAKTKTVVFFGNSLTAGYGLSTAEAFPALIQAKIDSLGLPYTVVNAGVSGETSSGGASRIDWVLRQAPDVFVLELGANDGLRGIPVVETEKNLQAIIDKVKAKNPAAKLILAGMQLPPNMGQVYTSGFRDLFPDLAKRNGMTLIPFLLEGVGGEAKLNQQDGIHPTAEGARIVAQNVWQVLQPLL
jgi:acyl-CoA thioesterase-1